MPVSWLEVFSSLSWRHDPLQTAGIDSSGRARGIVFHVGFARFVLCGGFTSFVALHLLDLVDVATGWRGCLISQHAPRKLHTRLIFVPYYLHDHMYDADATTAIQRFL